MCWSISLTAEATDNCSPLDWLLWEYKIDLFNDGKGVHGGYDFRVGSLTRQSFNRGDTVEYSHNPFVMTGIILLMQVEAISWYS
ncbi:MAG: hypothetical protein U0T81_00885 [Saprospiraceae bacterium]